MTKHRTLSPRVLRSAGATALLALSIALAGCKHGYSTADDPPSGATGELLAPLAPGTDFSRARSLYPLAVGNHWDYRIRARNVITTDQGPQPPQVEETTLAVEITGTATDGERTYFLQAELDSHLPCCGQVFMVRGSRFGLFHLQPIPPHSATIGDMPVDAEGAALEQYVERTVTDPARRAAFQRAAAAVAAKLAVARPVLGGSARLPPGAEPGEITLLSYPLYQGKRWLVMEEPRFARIVVGLDRINVPLGTFAAWKIRGTSEYFGPNDRVNFWYSNLGLVRIRYHFEADAVDNTGAIVGRVATDSDQSLTGIHVVRSGALAAGGE